MSNIISEKKWNPYYFFQPANTSRKNKLLNQQEERLDNLPNPMDKHRIPVLRLMPPGSTRRG